MSFSALPYGIIRNAALYYAMENKRRRVDPRSGVVSLWQKVIDLKQYHKANQSTIQQWNVADYEIRLKNVVF